MSDSQLSRSASAHTARIDRALKALQDRVKEQEAIIKELRASTTPIATEPATDSKEQLNQLRALTATYRSLTPSEPWLPPRESPIPALLALRSVDRTIKETRNCISTTESSLEVLQERLVKQQEDLADSKLMQTEMESRIESLNERIEERTQKTPSQIAREMVRDMKKRKSHYDEQTAKLVRAFDGFITEYLAPMLAVEELGGPIVGDIVDVDEELLQGGFSTQGKPKKIKPNEDKRQRRIDQIWGPRPTGDQEETWNEKSAAAAEMRELTEQLLNSLVDAEGNGPGAYVELQRESAAARFLVRSKVAQFHPKDASKLRLIDFGGEIDD